jgi:hypothetical protein
VAPVSRLRQVKYLNNIMEQDYRNVKRVMRPGLSFGGFWTTRRTLAGYESMAMIRKGQATTSGPKRGSSQRCSTSPRRGELIPRAHHSRPMLNVATEPSAAPKCRRLSHTASCQIWVVCFLTACDWHGWMAGSPMIKIWLASLTADPAGHRRTSVPKFLLWRVDRPERAPFARDGVMQKAQRLAQSCIALT